MWKKGDITKMFTNNLIPTTKNFIFNTNMKFLKY